MESEDKDAQQDVKLVLANKLFLLGVADVPDIEKQQLKEDVITIARADYMAGPYESWCQDFGWNVDEDLLTSLKTKIAEEIQKLDEKITDAEENLGESEVREALLNKALFFVRIGDKVRVLNENSKDCLVCEYEFKFVLSTTNVVIHKYTSYE
ncbi:hypothetical protein O6H91_Y112100 [Diphasiastrum complanatum]|nr:hypothetical protein O6H91_Y112100 [Diphasiastrum complanatum]